MTPAEIKEIFARFAKSNPSPKIELDYSNPYTLLVAIILSAQSTDVGVNKVTPALFKAADTPEKMLMLGENQLKEHIKTIGLFNSKAKNIVKMSQALVDRHGGQVPRDRAALEELPGVGKKTAGVFLNVVYGEPIIAVDTHVLRVANRIGLVNSDSPDKVDAQLNSIVPEELRKDAHHWLVLHGRYICKARVPLCGECPIYDLCQWPSRSQYSEARNQKK